MALGSEKNQVWCDKNSVKRRTEVGKGSHHKGAIRMLYSCMSSQNWVVWFNNRICKCQSRIHTKLQLQLLPVIGRKAFNNQGTIARTSATSKQVKDKEALKACIHITSHVDPWFLLLLSQPHLCPFLLAITMAKWLRLTTTMMKILFQTNLRVLGMATLATFLSKTDRCTDRLVFVPGLKSFNLTLPASK